MAPVIDTTFPLKAIADAHRHLEHGGQVGKIVVTVPAGTTRPTRHKGCPTRW
ncbi:zinc-binding dehydrogenase [Streptomyces sp. NPDC051020]|uniref:zinc-binding dehydrogenase n=1 Tax=Streptomyces sp. NPDC051020 TaxID=3155409 RepID=UPI0034178491